MSFLIILSAVSLTMSMVFLYASHPLALGLTLLMQSLVIVFSISMISKTSWMAYILFLIYLGALLVLFIYIASLAANEPFKKLNFMTYLLISIFTLSLLILSIFIDPLLIPIQNNSESSFFSFLFNFSTSQSILAMIYNIAYMKLTIFVIFYLLLTLIVVVKITSNFLGPLRTNL